MCCQHHLNQARDAFSKVLTTEPVLWRHLSHAKAVGTTVTLAFTVSWAPAPAPATVTYAPPERETVTV